MIKIISIGLFAFGMWFVPWYLDSWGLFVIWASLLSLILLVEWAKIHKHTERLVVEVFILAAILMSIKCILGTPYEWDGMSHIGILVIIIFGIWHFDKYRKTLKR